MGHQLSFPCPLLPGVDAFDSCDTEDTDALDAVHDKELLARALDLCFAIAPREGGCCMVHTAPDARE